MIKQTYKMRLILTKSKMQSITYIIHNRINLIKKQSYNSIRTVSNENISYDNNVTRIHDILYGIVYRYHMYASYYKIKNIRTYDNERNRYTMISMIIDRLVRRHIERLVVYDSLYHMYSLFHTKQKKKRHSTMVYNNSNMSDMMSMDTSKILVSRDDDNHHNIDALDQLLDSQHHKMKSMSNLSESMIQDAHDNIDIDVSYDARSSKLDMMKEMEKEAKKRMLEAQGKLQTVNILNNNDSVYSSYNDSDNHDIYNNNKTYTGVQSKNSSSPNKRESLNSNPSNKVKQLNRLDTIESKEDKTHLYGIETDKNMMMDDIIPASLVSPSSNFMRQDSGLPSNNIVNSNRSSKPPSMNNILTNSMKKEYNKSSIKSIKKDSSMKIDTIDNKMKMDKKVDAKKTTASKDVKDNTKNVKKIDTNSSKMKK